MRPDGYDGVALVGLAIFTVGVGMVSVPLALIAAGALLMALGMIGGVKKARGRGEFEGP